MSTTADYSELATNASILALGVLFGAVMASITDIPTAAVFAVMFGFLIVREYVSG